MNKKLILILTAVLLVGLVLVGVSRLLGGSAPAAQSQDLQSSGELSPFTGIHIQVKSADITITEGDTYSVSYRLHGREPLKKLEVENGTLILDTGFSAKWRGGLGDWQVLVTVPQGTQFKDLDLYSTAGSIRLEGFTFEEGSFSSVSGKVQVTDCVAESVEAETTSGAITVTGSFEDVEAESVSGEILVAGSVSDSVAADTVSGAITVQAPVQSIDAGNVSGGVYLNGENQGKKLKLDLGDPTAELGSVSGRITIETK